jgi:plastocyanin
MSNGDLFYICGGLLAVSAVLTSFIGLRVKSFPGKATPLVALWFIVLVGAATTFAVLHAKDEQTAKAAELSRASEEAEEEEASPVNGESASEEKGGGEAAESQPAETTPAATTLKLAADPSKIAFNATQLAANAGEVTIDFDNPAPLEHNVAIEQGGKQIAISETIASGETSVSANLKPGTYTFLCTVPGHAEAGMEGTLTVR